MTNRDAIEQMLSEDPERLDLYLAYAEHLRDDADPRGKLIMLQRRIAEASRGGGDQTRRKRRARRLRKLADDWLRRHEDVFLGPLAEWTRRGYVRIEWRLGFIRAARVSGQGQRRCPAPQALADLLAHPSAAYMTELRLGSSGKDGWCEPFFWVMKTAGVRPSLRHLVCAHPDEHGFYPIGHVGALWPLYPELRSIRIRSWNGGEPRSVRLRGPQGDIVLLRLESFALDIDTMDITELEALAAAHWPALRSVRIALGHGRDPGEAATPSSALSSALAPLLDPRRAPHLRQLSLRGDAATDELCQILIQEGLLAQLTELDLSHGRITDAAAQRLAGSGAIAHLERLDVRGSSLTDEGRAALVTALPSGCVF
ncbi:hypothetical protein [Haliangium sp.]|uniref:hypothetical protein n=1 Tax=Haliangium sp. TaxID=2663208 RepID=UPI003D1115C1